MTPASESQQGGSPREGRPAGLLQSAYAFLVSPRLAIALLVGVLVCCLVGAVFVPRDRAGELVFSTLWFNALLALLALSSAAAFFSRIWRRRLTLLSAGMILFHLSFAALLGGIVYNRLFFFRGVLRLTEGETLANGQLESYDEVEHGRLFSLSRLPGETTLVKMHANYRVGDDNKRAAYEIGVESGEARARSVIYPTEYLDFEGVRFFCSKEGYAVLVVMYGEDGRETYGAYVPLQSLRQDDGSYVYATGSAKGVAPFEFPPPPQQPRAVLQLTYLPSSAAERSGQVRVEVQSVGAHGERSALRSGLVKVGERFDGKDFALSPLEIRYWVGMDVRYDPGLWIILSSLCLGLAGMTMTFAGRLRQGQARKRAA